MSDDDSARTVQAAMYQAAKVFKGEGLSYGMRDARRLMIGALGIESNRLTLHLRDEMSREAETIFASFCARRTKREAVSRILGRRLFYGRWFKNGPHVLDPRPETEVLIERSLQVPFRTLLDIGTGSGCIAITLLAENTQARGLATDISAEALDVAQGNASAHGVQERLQFGVSDWFSAVEGHYDLIVSNPPYIHPDEMEELDPEVRYGDPRIALTDFVDGLTGYREIARNAATFLTPGGRVLVEIGPAQGNAVLNLFARAGFADSTIHLDLDGRDRVVEAFVPES